ncbi:MAG: CDP-glycerol glycerophosphotransferase family protein [Simkaniaceae bacterium]|nr:CDP-glycerol glycerophosphotransferase family protein [Simkaniaceae bacterium]
MRTIGLLYGPYDQHIDHLVPICIKKQIPIAVTETHIARLIEKYYPKIEIAKHSYAEMTQFLAENFDQLLTTHSKFLIPSLFFGAEVMHGKTLQSIWVPHGNSDKGFDSKLAQFLQEETGALVYGRRMCDFLSKKLNKFALHPTHFFDESKLDHEQPTLFHVGNYRYSFYQENQPFFEEKITPIFSKFSHEKTILFCPTWGQEYQMFFDEMKVLIEKTKNRYNLIIKIHPVTLRQSPTRFDHFIEENPNVCFLKNFPLIYPLLSKTDLYIGDYSSIGYDFLTFDRPMLFVQRPGPEKEERYLLQCGHNLIPEKFDMIEKYIEKALADPSFSPIRRRLYREAFSMDR